MIDSTTDLERRRFPWALTRIELWGLVGAVGALFVAILLGAIWGPLFLVGLFLAAVSLLAFRTSERAPPNDADAIVSPVDGIVTSISDELPPAELRLSGGDFLRIRIASSPASTVSVHAPMTGEIQSLIEEAGDPNTRFAQNPDEVGLASAYAVFSSGDQRVGIRAVTGGLGPRLDITSEAGDPVRVGREIGYRRLGGWCDVWVPNGLPIAVWPGMSLKAAETRLVFPSSIDGKKGGTQDSTSEDAEPFVMPELETDDSASAPVEAKTSEPVADDEEKPDETKTEDAVEEKGPSEKDEGTVKDASEQFARLREKVESAKTKDGD